jgi:hypothetical protein
MSCKICGTNHRNLQDHPYTSDRNTGFMHNSNVDHVESAPPAGKPGEPDFGTHEQVIAGLDAINEHNRAEIAINQAFYDIVPLIFGTVKGGADKIREILRGLRNSSHSEAICAAAEVVDKFRGWQNEEFVANLIEQILALALSLAQPDGTKSGPT